jgi:hypothetical protein
MAASIPQELKDKLSGPLDTVLSRHRPDITRMAGNSGGLTAAALQNDALVRKIAEYCHEALPWPVRVAVKKPVFVEFVMANRATVAARLLASPATAGEPAVS